ncbi:MAG: ABC transporter substrate-binding protein [Pseudomonadota bacterium]|nr:ABC transporter substrate-binding protein [Pseudomonadota bacterium]
MKRALTALALITGLTGTALAESVTINTALGEATIAANPDMTAVYDMGALDILAALEVNGIESVSNTYLDWLAAYSGDLGTLFEPDFEALNAASPDLIIAGGRSSTQVDALARIAPTIDMTMWGDNLLDQTRDRLTTYGIIYGKESEAAKLISELDAEIAETRAAVQGKGTALILLTNGGKISAYGAGGRFGWLHTELGLPEVLEGMEDTEHGESVSFEFIREANPDWILVLDRVAAIGGEGENAQATLDNVLIAETKAAKNDQIIYLNAGDIYIAGGGIQSTLKTLELLKSAFGENS